MLTLPDKQIDFVMKATRTLLSRHGVVTNYNEV